MTTLELTDAEAMALMLLLKLGMDHYTGEPVSEETIDGLHTVPYSAIDSIIQKVSDAGEQAASAAVEGNA